MTFLRLLRITGAGAWSRRQRREGGGGQGAGPASGNISDHRARQIPARPRPPVISPSFPGHEDRPFNVRETSPTFKQFFLKNIYYQFFYFLAPTGAQEVTLSVRPSVCLSGASLSRAVNFHLSMSESTQRAMRAI